MPKPCFLIVSSSAADFRCPWHDRQMRLANGKIASLADYTLRIRLFTDPSGPDEEIQIGVHAARSFASWP